MNITKVNFKISGNWDEQSKALMAQYPLLTVADLQFEVGREDELIKRVETRLNKKYDEVITMIRKVQPIVF